MADGGQPERDVADRCDVARRERQAELVGQVVEQLDALAQRGLQPRQLVREVDLRRLDRGAQHRRLHRAGEDHRAARGAHEAALLGVREDDRAARGGEGLVQRGGDDHARVPAERFERRPAAVRARPADAVRVVDVEAQLRVAVEQFGEPGERREVGEHRVDAVGHVPDALVLGGEALDHRLQAIELVVADQLDGRALDAQLVGRHLHAGVDLMVEEDGVRRLDEHRQRREMPERRGRHDERVAAEHLVEQRLELDVLRRGEVRPRGRELRSVARDGVDHGVAHARVELEPEIAAGAEVDPRTAVRARRCARRARGRPA